MAGTPDPLIGLDAAAELFKALGHPLRLRLVCGLSREPASLSRIAEKLEMPISTVATHLAVLRRSGILAEDRAGAQIRFHVRDPRTRIVLGSLCGSGATVAPDEWAWDQLSHLPRHR